MSACVHTYIDIYIYIYIHILYTYYWAASDENHGSYEGNMLASESCRRAWA